MKDMEIPKPGHGQVLIQTKGDHHLRQRYPLYLQGTCGKGPEGYIPGMVAGHEPCGVIVEEGEGLRRISKRGQGHCLPYFRLRCLQ